MIQIDDAGSGSLIGGTIIGAMRVETNDFYYEVIPVDYFKTPEFDQKKYCDYCVEIIKRIIIELKVTKYEEIEICQGYIFDKARIYLKKNNFNFISTKISDPLQSIIEETFMDYVIGLGVPLNYLEYTKYPFHFHRLLKWVLADYKKRESLCKTGWKSWKKYSNISTSLYKDYLYGGCYSCLKCGNIIETPSKIKVVKFTTNREYFIYLHEKCHI